MEDRRKVKELNPDAERVKEEATDLTPCPSPHRSAWHVSHVRRALPTVERRALLLEKSKLVLSFCRAPLSSSEERGRG